MSDTSVAFETKVIGEDSKSYRISDICNAFGKGFDQCFRNLGNPYQKQSPEYVAYIYGIERGKEEKEDDV